MVLGPASLPGDGGLEMDRTGWLWAIEAPLDSMLIVPALLAPCVGAGIACAGVGLTVSTFIRGEEAC